jgi:hypothetical protein
MGEWRDEIRSRLDGLALDPAREAEIVEEFEQHLDDRHAELLAEGLGNETAREQALSELETDDLLRASMRRLRQSQTLPPVVPGAPSRGIFADIVQCAHGATSGELDDDLLFYLRSRGIPELQAKTMLIQAFVADAFEQVSSEEIRDVLNGLAGRWLEGSTKDLAHA